MKTILNSTSPELQLKQRFAQLDRLKTTVDKDRPGLSFLVGRHLAIVNRYLELDLAQQRLLTPADFQPILQSVEPRPDQQRTSEVRGFMFQEYLAEPPLFKEPATTPQQPAQSREEESFVEKKFAPLVQLSAKLSFQRAKLEREPGPAVRRRVNPRLLSALTQPLLGALTVNMQDVCSELIEQLLEEQVQFLNAWQEQQKSALNRSGVPAHVRQIVGLMDEWIDLD